MADPASHPEEESKQLKLSSIAEFFNSDVLSDIVIVNPHTGANYK